METTIALAGPNQAVGRSIGLRVGSVVAALALVFTAFVLLQDRADAVPSAGSAAVATAAVGGAAQIGTNFVCSILLSIRASFAANPFFGFVANIISSLLVSFGCVISPGVATPSPFPFGFGVAVG